jgi:hypothetical protein
MFWKIFFLGIFRFFNILILKINFKNKKYIILIYIQVKNIFLKIIIVTILTSSKWCVGQDSKCECSFKTSICRRINKLDSVVAVAF